MKRRTEVRRFIDGPSIAHQSLKEVVAVTAVELAALHAAVLETDARNHMGRDRYDPAFPAVPCRRARLASCQVNASRPFRTGSPSCVCWSQPWRARKQKRSAADWIFFMMASRKSRRMAAGRIVLGALEDCEYSQRRTQPAGVIPPSQITAVIDSSPHSAVPASSPHPASQRSAHCPSPSPAGPRLQCPPH